MWLYLILTTQLLYGCWVATPVLTDDVVNRPTRHSLPRELESLYGSDMNGRCTSVSGAISSDICNGTSVLNDGIIPALSGVSDSTSQWAAQLFTMNRSETDSIVISFEVPQRLYNRVELSVFNCPERKIYAPKVIVHNDASFLPERNVDLLGFQRTVKTLLETSCDYLLKYCLQLSGGFILSHVNLEFPYQNNSDFVFLGEVTFLNVINGQCGQPQQITSAVTLVPLPSDLATSPTNTAPPTTESTTSTTVSTHTGASQPTTSATNTSGGSQDGPFPVSAIAAVVVILLFFIIVVAIVVLVMFLCMRNRKRKYETDKVHQLQSVVMENKEDEKEDETHVYMLDNGCSSPTQNGVGFASGGAAINSDSDKARQSDNIYSSLREDEKKRNEVTLKNLSVIDDQYSKLNHDQGELSSLTARHSPSPRKLSPGALEGDMYAVPDKKSTPAVPEKSSELVQYLDAKDVKHSEEAILQNMPEYSEIDKRSFSVRSGSLGPVPLSNPAALGVLNGLSSNPLYEQTNVRPPHVKPRKSANSGSGVLEADPIYAEPLPPNVHEPEWDPDQNIYESIYSEPLNPSLFMQEREDLDSDELCPYSSIYTVAVAPLADKPLSVSIGNIKEINHLGNGNFGQVVLAQTVGLMPKDLGLDSEAPYTLVAVKKLKQSASKQTREAFDKEVQFMSRLNHPNVIRLLGVCTDEVTPFLMMEYMTNGDLNQYLNGFNSIGDGNSEKALSISTSRLIHMITQIASAMHYLASQNFVHRDLATRNCLVGSKDTIKVSDFGMSRSLYESDYYVIRGHAILPIRWMATECFYGKFSAKTDVWAFGVTMWEIFTLCKEPPYSHLEDREIVEEAIKGPDRVLLKRPLECPEKMFIIMKKCWVYEAEQRPTFDELFKLLSSS